MPPRFHELPEEIVDAIRDAARAVKRRADLAGSQYPEDRLDNHYESYLGDIEQELTPILWRALKLDEDAEDPKNTEDLKNKS